VLDAYVHVCEKLAEDGHRRLLGFRAGDRSDFAGWLASVTRNLCIDRLRQRDGRRRLPAAIARLDPLARELFEEVYWRGSAPQEAFERLASRQPGLDPARVGQALDAIAAALSPRQLAEVLLGGRRAEVATPTEALEQVADERDDPERDLLHRRELAELAAAVEALPADDRLLLRLRFEQNLTLEAAGRGAGIDDPRRVHARLGRILRRLRQALGAPARTPGRRLKDRPSVR
jgi:RNA polymerase sigma factor (sigma-70 family)